MTESSARQRRVEDRRQQILDAARQQADTGGWDSVTTRGLADTIGYSQPVLYGHFPGGKSQIMLEVSLGGFAELAKQCESALGRKHGIRAVEAVANAYLDFGAHHPAIYEAMFLQPTAAHFASDDSESELRAGFEVLAKAIDDTGAGTATEIFWSALHGLCLLERANRVRPQHRQHRITELASRYTTTQS